MVPLLLLGLGDTFDMPIIHVLQTGVPAQDDPFNFFFSLMVGIGFLLFITAAIIHLLGRSAE